MTPKYTDVLKQKRNKPNELSNITIDRTTRYVRPANSINEIMERKDITNSLHDALNRLKIENLAERDSIDEDGTEDILLRTKPFKVFARNSQRGSSKVVCSLVSVCEINCLRIFQIENVFFFRISNKIICLMRKS